MADLKVDESGDLVTGYFFELYVESAKSRRLHEIPDWIISSLPDGCGFARAEIVDSRSTELFECAADRSHRTDRRYDEMKIDGCGIVRPLIPCDPCTQAILVREDIFTALGGSGLIGADGRPVTLQAEARPMNLMVGPQIYFLRMPGRAINRPARVFPESENKCPFCGFAPMVCHTCGCEQGLCPGCAEVWYAPVGRIDPTDAHQAKLIRLYPTPEKGSIVEAKLWDGNDFVSRLVVTWRVVDFLLRLHAAPFKARPLRTDLNGISEEQREWLERARRPIANN